MSRARWPSSVKPKCPPQSAFGVLPVCVREGGGLIEKGRKEGWREERRDDVMALVRNGLLRSSDLYRG